ncbi:MAG: hypothetical protein ABEH64_09745 [Salinirussus sp.]
MPLTWLPEDDKHPIRPDLPVFRHLTFTEVHSLELGIYVGLLVYFSLLVGTGGAVATLLISIVRFTISDGKAKNGATNAMHRIGFHDVRQEPPYFGAGAIFAFVGAVIIGRLWVFFDLGPLLPA